MPPARPLARSHDFEFAVSPPPFPVRAQWGQRPIPGHFPPSLLDRSWVMEFPWLLTDAGRGQRLRIPTIDRKSTRLNSSHLVISYAVFCLKKNKHPQWTTQAILDNNNNASTTGLQLRA